MMKRRRPACLLLFLILPVVACAPGARPVDRERPGTALADGAIPPAQDGGQVEPPTEDARDAAPAAPDLGAPTDIALPPDVGAPPDVALPADVAPPTDVAPPATDAADAVAPPIDATRTPADATPPPSDGAHPPTDATLPPEDSGVAAPEPPGTASPSSAGPGVGHGGLDIAANIGFAGTLFYNHRHAPGEPSVKGRILVAPTGTHGSGAPPDDTVVTINDVPLVHAAGDLSASARYFVVDPAGQQPLIASDGFLHISAASSATGASRALNLACPFALAVTLTPRPGALAAGTAQIQLAWPAGALPVQARDYSAFGLTSPTVTLWGFDLTSQVLSFVSNFQPLAADAIGAIVPIGTTTASGYAVDVAFPGIFFVDGETAGVCGRVQRFVYSK